MPVDRQRLIAEFVVNINYNGIVDIAPDGGTWPVPIDSNDRTVNSQKYSHMYIVY
jgi:hypothetical protein